MCSFVLFCSGETWASTRTRVGIFLHNLGNSSPLWRCLKSLWTSIPPEHLPKVLQCFLGTAPLMKMSNMLHTEVKQVEISQAPSGHWDQVSRTLSQGLSQVFVVVSTLVHPQGTHTICFWTASGCCFCNRCNFMVNVLYLPFASSAALQRRPLASEEVFWANFS